MLPSAVKTTKTAVADLIRQIQTFEHLGCDEGGATAPCIRCLADQAAESMATGADMAAIVEACQFWIPRVMQTGCAFEQEYNLSAVERIQHTMRAVEYLTNGQLLPRNFKGDVIVVAMGNSYPGTGMNCANEYHWDELVVAYDNPDYYDDGVTPTGYMIRRNSSC